MRRMLTRPLVLLLLNVFVPTTPNPTSGFFIMVPKEDVVELDMSVDEGLRLIMSLGVVVPVPKQKEQEAVAQTTDRP